ncbi:MAG: hypothetical protein LQ340_003362 [Diploschistes diacapsis]|nr:MAG: hypothetical protein LQ340_003362 [Diploschistes diacapsis]
MDEAATQMIKDTTHDLKKIRSQLHQPIYAELLRAQQHILSQKRSLEYVKRLECLDVGKLIRPAEASQRQPEAKHVAGPQSEKIPISKRTLNAIQLWQRKYIAVSHRWPPPGKTVADGKYRISGQPNKVCNSVLERAISYAKYRKCSLLWIDRECIPENDSEERDCAIHSMDLVYSLSKYPIALLVVRIQSNKELSLLADFLEGKFVDDHRKSHQNAMIKSAKAREAFELLDRLTSDEWWRRGWTFLEDYRASIKMKILIPHDHHISALKRSSRMACLFGSLDGELCVKSTRFRRETSRFCLAFKEICDQQQRQKCERILRRAGKYTVLLRNTCERSGDSIYRPMSPTIFEDIGKRDISKIEDCLAIAANCCSYQVRLSTEYLQKIIRSLSVALLALYLLNGEILLDADRNQAEQKAAPFSFDAPMIESLKGCSLRLYEPSMDKELIFLKSCRFPSVKLRKDGAQTTGHLWKVGRSFEPNYMTGSCRKDDRRQGLTWRERRYIRQLASELGSGSHGRQYVDLAEHLHVYLEEDAILSEEDNLSLAKRFKDWMASKVASAIDSSRKVLYLACLTDGSDQASSSYSGIFVGNGTDVQPPRYIFTASKPGCGFGDIGRHVSLEVNIQGLTDEGYPRLFARDWIYGLCFYTGAKKNHMVFPWPKALTV